MRGKEKLEAFSQQLTEQGIYKRIIVRPITGAVLDAEKRQGARTDIGTSGENRQKFLTRVSCRSPAQS